MPTTSRMLATNHSQEVLGTVLRGGKLSTVPARTSVTPKVGTRLRWITPSCAIARSQIRSHFLGTSFDALLL